jgi:hypothetical protein
MAGKTDTASAEPKRKPIWQRPITWIAGIVVAALGTFLTGALVEFFQDNAPALPSTGTPVTVSGVETYRTGTYADSVAFPRGTQFDDATLAELNTQRTAGRDTEWLEERGGSALGSVFFQVMLTGNRSDGVRVLDAAVSPECGPPLDGLLFSDPPAGAQESIGLYFDLDAINPRAMSAADPTQPYFPANTIHLTDGESQVLLVEAHTETQHCAFTLNLTIMDGDKETEQTVTLPEDRPFEVTAFIDETQYEQVYLGGVICPTWVRANYAYFADAYDGSQCTGY